MLINFLAIPEYALDYPALPKHPVPKEDVAASDSDKLFYKPQRQQPILQTILQGQIADMESPGLLIKGRLRNVWYLSLKRIGSKVFIC